MKRVLFPGSFNPFTRGHADIVERALLLFDEVVIAIGCNVQKTDDAQKQERMQQEMAARAACIAQRYVHASRVRVITYTTLTAEVAQQQQACAILRSVRSIKDYEYEMQMADVNRHLTGIETVVLFARPELASLSSSVVRELQQFGYDTTEFLP